MPGDGTGAWAAIPDATATPEATRHDQRQQTPATTNGGRTFRQDQDAEYVVAAQHDRVEGAIVAAERMIVGDERGGNAHHDTETFTPRSLAPLEDLRVLLAECQIDDPEQPQPVSAGLFGYLGYDMVRYMERIPDNKPVGVDVPEAIMIRPTLLAIFDQIENKFTLVTPVWFDKSAAPQIAYEAAQTRLHRALTDLQKPLPHQAPSSDSSYRRTPVSSASDSEHMNPTTARTETPPPASNMSEAAFVNMVTRAKDYIRAGDIFQVVLSQRFTLPFTQPSFALYRAVRRLEPSPFLFHFDFGAFSVVGASPEIMVRLRDDKVTIRPLAGTRPRNHGNRSDQELEAELLADPKELAEHLMLVDLGRNDVGRVAKQGTVKVTALNTVEYYKHVMHIVSNVEGELAAKYDAIDALKSGFPAGTLSGAPKIRSMEIITEQEPDRRGVYGGCIGYFGANGSMDTAIAIRTAVIKDGQLHVQAGAGVVYDSDPQAEFRETQAKAKGMLRAAEAALAFCSPKSSNQVE